LTKNQEYVSQKYEKSNFSTNAQNRIRPRPKAPGLRGVFDTKNMTKAENATRSVSGYV